MRSNKPVKNLKDLILPYTFIPKESVSGNTNGKRISLIKGIKTSLKIEEYETLLNSGYGYLLEH